MEPEYMIIRLSLHQVFGLSVFQYTAYYLAYDIGVFGYDFIHSLLQAIYGRYQYLFIICLAQQSGYGKFVGTFHCLVEIAPGPAKFVLEFPAERGHLFHGLHTAFRVLVGKLHKRGTDIRAYAPELL